MSNNKKSATLGMPHGTANGRLRKMLLFKQLKKHNENVCVRCEQIIEAIDDLSVEHIRPWEGVSADLFWDLDNVAFSHMRCNRPHKFITENLGILAKPIDSPLGMAWCGTHKKFLDIKLFYKNRSNANGLCSECKECHDKQQGHGTIRGRISRVVSVND